MSRPSAVRRAAQRLEQARTAFEREIRLAHKEGAPLRAIAENAGVSHEQVRRIVRG